MQPESAAFLWDAHDASKKAVSIASGLDIEEYLSQWVLQSAVERQLEILGEALRNLRAKNPDTAERIPNVHAIIATRNILVHAYAQVDQQKVWEIITQDLPVLVPVLEALLSEIEAD
jgi:uncharacterized protein with HEPN domain